MSVATDLNEYARELNEDISARDRVEIDRLANRQAEVCLEFLRLCDVYGITNTNPVPHEYSAHEEIKTRCQWVAIGSNLLGAAQAILLTARGATEHKKVLIIIALGVFSFSEALVELALATINRGQFARRFNWLSVPVVTLGILAASVLLLARIASADIAEAIVGLIPLALSG